MRYINLTPHVVTIYQGDEVILAIPDNGPVARLDKNVISIYTLDGVSRITVTLGEVSGLPDPESDVTYIVSMPLLMGLLARGIYRDDVVYPFDPVRDEQGRIIGCRHLARLTTCTTDTTKMTFGWSKHGCRRHTNIPAVDELLTLLQDAQDCNYFPASTLAGFDLDKSAGTPREQWSMGLIRLTSGAVLERGRSLGAVWACTRLPDGHRTPCNASCPEHCSIGCETARAMGLDAKFPRAMS